MTAHIQDLRKLLKESEAKRVGEIFRQYWMRTDSIDDLKEILEAAEKTLKFYAKDVGWHLGSDLYYENKDRFRRYSDELREEREQLLSLYLHNRETLDQIKSISSYFRREF